MKIYIKCIVFTFNFFCVEYNIFIKICVTIIRYGENAKRSSFNKRLFIYIKI